jgi:CHAT domain-containing protein/tetratricopeptide (TPR) repeat protein
MSKVKQGGQEMDVPLNAEILMMQRLEAQSQKDPRVTELLVEVYERLIKKVRPEQNLSFYASVQNKLGNAYRKLPTGDRAINIAKAITCYEEALRYWTPERDPFDYAQIQHKLGNAYRELPADDRAANLSQAIICYEEALRFWTPETAPMAYAGVQNNLGIAYSELPTGNRLENMEKGIAHYEEALRFWTPETAPFEYARVQTCLGATYRRLPTGDDATNVTKAIAYHQEALRFWTPETYPSGYAGVKYNLGIAYLDLLTGDRVANLVNAIGCFQEALRFWTPGTPIDYAKIQGALEDAYSQLSLPDGVAIPSDFKEDMLLALQLENQRQSDPQVVTFLIQAYKRMIGKLQPDKNSRFYASIQISLGNVYCTSSTGKRETNLAKGIDCYREALRFLTPETSPSGYVNAQCNLGNTYYELPTGDRVANLTQTIACYREALRFLTPELDPTMYADVQVVLGFAYSELPTEKQEANLTQAIACFQEALRFCTIEADPSKYAEIQRVLGNTYIRLSTDDREREANLTEAIACYQEALRFYSPETAALDYGKVQHRLGLAYQGLRTGDRTTNLTKAIACSQEALRFLTPETAPNEYAHIQKNLGSAYRDLPTGDRTANLTQAIAYYQEASHYLTGDAAPLEYAHIQNGLSTVYGELSTGDRTANLIQAIACSLEALRYLTAEDAPLVYSSIQNNLGLAYSELPTGDREDNLTKAIAYYQEALRFRTLETTPWKYALTQNNLGNAYTHLPTGNLTADLSNALTCFQEALRVWTPETSPLNYAITQMNLGSAYTRLSSTGAMDQAISCFKEALRFLTPQVAPLDYAQTLGNLGKAHYDHLNDDHTALTCFREALNFLTPETVPVDSRKISHTMADIYFAQGNWSEALDAYRTAMNAGEQLYRAGLFTESKATEVAENAAIYRHAAFAAARLGKGTEALLILERGKTRLLAEALRLRVPRPANVPDVVWSAFEEAGNAVRAVQIEGATLPDEEQERDLVRMYMARGQAARSANAKLDAAIKRVRDYAPEFLQEVDLQTLRASLPDERTALVAFSFTEQGSIGLVLGYLDQDVQVVEAPTFTQTDLQRLFVQWDIDGEPVGGWLGSYNRYQLEHDQVTLAAWQETITNTLTELGQHVLTPVLSALPANIERIILLPSAELFLFPLHAAPLSENGQERLGDRYEVCYAPSVEVLVNTRAKAMREVTPELYAVINPEADPNLVFTSIEGIAIAGLFAHGETDEGHVGTKQRVLAGVRGRSYVHFSCHGSYNWNNPPASGLYLADESLSLFDLQQGEADLSAARLVTLSACETGITDVLQGVAEEYVGIPAGFLLAGVPCVVSSLWAVPDLSTAMLMERFYRNHLNKGMDVAAALQEAQLWVRELRVGEVAQYAEQRYQQAQQEGQTKLYSVLRYYRSQARQKPIWRPFEHPYYWAAFTVNGW